jgi:hypothetical protein
MTAETLKKLDRKLRKITDPLGSGFPVLRKAVEEYAEQYETQPEEAMRQYILWKWRKV